eukprot:scaffold10691_cov76-Phaeocystis_antarctica.AAC.1
MDTKGAREARARVVPELIGFGVEPSKVPSVVPVLLREIPCRLDVPHTSGIWMCRCADVACSDGPCAAMPALR